MDDVRFDRLAATFATAPSRRRLLGTLLGTALAGLLDRPESATAKKKKKNCPPGRPRCDNKCCQPFETCKGGRCVHHCRDGKKNLGETDKDCGGTCLPETCGVQKGCAFDADCFTGICEDVGEGGTKICGQCRQDVDCNVHPGTPRCLSHFCHDCAADFDCPAPGDFPEKRFCVAPADVGCPRNQPCVCRECREDSDCPPGELCDERGNCDGSECADDDDCANRPDRRTVCSDGSCVQCRNDDDCEADDVCVDGFCSECRDNADCPAARPVCDQNHDCIAA